jgi:cbb3-type cytochrome oxidase subunit 3
MVEYIYAAVVLALGILMIVLACWDWYAGRHQRRAQRQAARRAGYLR